MRDLSSVHRLLVPWILTISTTVAAQQAWVAEGGGLKDSTTGTIWSNAICAVGPGFCFNRDQALAYAAQLTQGGFADWRIPSKKELEKACADGAYAALKGHYSTGIDWERPFWTTDLQAKRWPWWVNLVNCYTVSVGAGSTAAVLCARGPEYTGKGGGKGGGKKGGGKGNNLTGGGGSSTDYYGTATSGCHGVPSIDSKGEPLAGTRQFAITCATAPKHASGVLLLSYARTSVLLPELRLRLLVDPSALAISHVVHADGKGLQKTELPLPPGARGAAFFGQFLWLDPSCPTQQLSASAGLAVRVQ